MQEAPKPAVSAQTDDPRIRDRRPLVKDVDDIETAVERIDLPRVERLESFDDALGEDEAEALEVLVERREYVRGCAPVPSGTTTFFRRRTEIAFMEGRSV